MLCKGDKDVRFWRQILSPYISIKSCTRQDSQPVNSSCVCSQSLFKNLTVILVHLVFCTTLFPTCVLQIICSSPCCTRVGFITCTFREGKYAICLGTPNSGAVIMGYCFPVIGSLLLTTRCDMIWRASAFSCSSTRNANGYGGFWILSSGERLVLGEKNHKKFFFEKLSGEAHIQLTRAITKYPTINLKGYILSLSSK